MARKKYTDKERAAAKKESDRKWLEKINADPVRKAAKKATAARSREKNKNTPEYKARKIRASNKWREKNKDTPEYKANNLARSKEWREKNEADPEFKANRSAINSRYREKHKDDPAYRLARCETSKKVYANIMADPDRKVELERKLKQRRYSSMSKTGLSGEERLWFLDEHQGGKCAICKTTEPGANGWNTDHCHFTGKPRGILCHACNAGLGLFKDSAETLKKAIAYIEAPPIFSHKPWADRRGKIKKGKNAPKKKPAKTPVAKKRKPTKKKKVAAPTAQTSIFPMLD